MWSVGREELDDDIAQVAPLNGLHAVVGEAGLGGFAPALGHDVCGERDHRHVRIIVGVLPFADTSAGGVSVHAGHFDVALKGKVGMCDRGMRQREVGRVESGCWEGV